MLRRSPLILALALVATCLVLPSLADDKARAPLPEPDIPISKLNAAQRAAWDVVRVGHQHAGQEGWVLKPGWGLPRGCTDLGDNSDFFTRVLPRNGALSLDWAEVRRVRGKLAIYASGTGPKVLPPGLTNRPSIAANEAWQRLLQAIGARGDGSKDAAEPPTLRLTEEEDAEPGATRTQPRVRLVYQFKSPSCSVVISVDANTGEVGDAHLSFLGAQFFPTGNPWFDFLSNTHGKWVATRSPRAAGV